MYIFVVGLNHRTASVEVREKLSFGEAAVKSALLMLQDASVIEGCAILSTCNRTEVYAATRDLEAGIKKVIQFLAARCDEEVTNLREYLYTYTLYDAVRHLFRVAGGLDSMILGETQILGQVVQAYDLARNQGATNSVLNTLFQRAITVGKRVRAETEIDQHPVSVSYAAVELARQHFGSLTGKTALIIGTGKMGRLTLENLKSKGTSTVLITNRTHCKAKALAGTVNAQEIYWQDLDDALKRVDMLFSCTAAPHLILSADRVTRAIRPAKKDCLFVDLAVPRDIDPAVKELPGVTLFDVDDLKEVLDHNLALRERAAIEGEKLIEEELNAFFQWLSTQTVVPTIKALKLFAEEIKNEEVTRALNRLGPVTEREKKIVNSMASSILNRLLHNPVMNLKEEAAHSNQGHFYARILEKLFELDVADDVLKNDPGDELSARKNSHWNS